METGKPGLASASVHSSITAQTEKRMDNQAPLTAVYIHTVPALPAQPYPQPPADAWGPATLHLAMPPLYSKEMLPFLTLHIAGGLQSQPGLSLAAAAPAARSKSAGKHVCSHCGRDCMKPSVLEKHLRCHTGERPYPCTTCGVSFKTQSNLYKHKRTQAHARLSSESEQSSLGSLDSMSSPRDIHASSLSVDESTEELGSVEKNPTLPAMTCPAQTTKVYSVNTQGSGGEKTESTPVGHRTEPNESAKVTKEEEKQKVENEKPLLTVSRHIPLQRQEATLFSKQWESSVSSGKSQSHESTDSGFSESSDHYSSPASVLPDHSMDSLTESTREHLKEITSTQRPSEPSQGEQEPKDNAKQQGQKTLEERISKLISENTAVVEDKQLENVRPRKTVLSKQGSIDLPMPYTYKDSFHFDMRINKTINGGLQRNRKPGLYSSVPTQHSTTIEHAPLTRSNSLPFSVTLLQPERSSPKSCYQSDYVTLFRRGSSGQINPTGFAIKPVNQQSSTHRPLVRQAAVDCNHTTDGLFVNSSVEEVCAGSLSCDGDGGDICGEPSNRKFRRKKAQKFAYHKWYMYGGGTFKKLYNVEKGGDRGVIKGRKSINPEHEVVPGPKKKLSTVHKETVATTGSAINITSSNETVCHPGCPPAKPSLISAADYDLKTSHLHASNSFLKTPLRRNLSLSILPLPSVASLGGHKTSSLSSVETGGLTNEEKHTDPTPQLCGAHVPSDRKKQRTDDKITSPLKMEVNPSTMSHPPPSIVGSRPQHDTHLSYINLQTNQKHMQLKGVLFPPCIINANALSVNTSPATSISSAAKTSFLPKYQLKLPNADSNTSLHVGDKPTGIEDHTFTSALSSSHNDQTSPLVTTSEKKDSDPVTSPLMQTCEMKKTFSTTQAHLLSPCMATTLCQVKTSRFNENAAPSLSVVQRPFAATTITTTCLKDYQSGLCSTSIQPSRSDTASVPLQLHRPVEPTVAHIPAMPLITTASNQTSTAAVTAFSQSQSNSNPPLSHSQLSTASDPVNRAYASPNTASVPCHIVPCDMVQPAAQNVFHVHTADLQICLQLISDEQLALIEPQIENQADSSLSQRSMEALGPEVTQSKVQSSVTMEISSEGRGHQHLGHQKEMDQSGSLATLHMESKKPPLSVHFGKVQPNIHMIEHSNSSQAAVSAESKPPETLGLTLHPHKYSHVNTATETLNSSSSAMSAAASHKGVKSGRRQTSQEERTPSLNHCAEEQLLLDRRVSQGQLVSQTLSGQHSLSVTCLSPSTVNQNSTRSDLLEKESQQKLSSRLESGEPHPSLQVKSSQASSVAGADKLSGLVSTFSFNKCKTPRQLKPQASIYSGNPAEPTLSETLNPSQHASRGCDRVGPLDNSSPLQEMTFNESQDVICSAHSEQQLGLFTSVTSNIQVERPRNTPAVLTHIQSPSTGLTEGASQMGCAAQKESQTWAHGGLSLGQPDSTDWRPKQSREAGETNHHSVEGQGRGAVMGEDNNRGIKSDQVPDQWGNTKTKCRYMGSSDMLKPVGEDRQVKADSCKNSWLSEQDLQHHSQTHSGMFECPPQSPLQAPSSSGNLNMPVSSGTTGLFNSAQPLLEMSNFYFSQQHWESSIIHNHQAQRILSEFSSSEHIKEQDKSQNAFSQIECSPQQRFPLQDEKQDQKQKSSSLSPDVKTSSIRHYCQVSHSVQGSRATAGYKGDNNMLDNRLPSKTFNYAEPEQNTKDWASNDYTVQSSNSGRPDTTNKYQSLLLAGQLQGYQSAECLTSGVRPVQSCQDYAGDTSSSDDEGKLIIALGEK